MPKVKFLSTALAAFLLASNPASAVTTPEVIDAIDNKIEETIDQLTDLWNSYKSNSTTDKNQLFADSAALQAILDQLMTAKTTISNDPNVDLDGLIVALHLDVSPH